MRTSFFAVKKPPLSDLLKLALLITVALAISGCTAGVTDQAQVGNLSVNDTSSGHMQPGVNTTPAGNMRVNDALVELTPEVFMIGQGSPGIRIIYPFNDDVANGTIVIAGTLADKNITIASISANGGTWQVTVTGGAFRAEVNITGPGEIQVGAVNSSGVAMSSRVLLDGDGLPAPYEMLCGFDPLNPDSDSNRTIGNEAGNGIADGYELLDGSLPAFVKYRAGAHPLAYDTDGDGLTDFFEVMKLIPFCVTAKEDTDGDGISDFHEDTDTDGLINGKEQELGTDPLKKDSDNDGLLDGNEIDLGSNPLREDSDSDGLTDGFEAKVGSNPMKPDSDGDGTPDADETHTYLFSLDMPRIDIAITGKGDIIDEFRAVNETSEYYAGHPAGRGALVAVYPNALVDSMDVTLPYAGTIPDPGNLAIAYYNNTIGMFLPVDSVVDELNHTVRGHIDMHEIETSRWGDLMVRVFDVRALYDLNLEIAIFNAPISNYMPEERTVRIEIRDTVNISDISRGPGGGLTVTNRTLRFLPTESEVSAGK